MLPMQRRPSMCRSLPTCRSHREGARAKGESDPRLVGTRNTTLLIVGISFPGAPSKKFRENRSKTP